MTKTRGESLPLREWPLFAWLVAWVVIYEMIYTMGSNLK